MCVSLVRSIAHPSLPVRNVVASCISQLVCTAHDLAACNPLLSALVHTLEDEQAAGPLAVEAALCVLSKLAEDVPQLLDTDPSRPLDRLIPACIRLCTNYPNPIRGLALQIVNHLMLVMPSALSHNMEPFLQALFTTADDPSAQVRKRICTAICLLMEAMPTALGVHMNNVIEFMLICSTHEDPLVAREASEFWSLFAHVSLSPNVLRPFLPRLVPILLHNMTYSEEEVKSIDCKIANDNVTVGRNHTTDGPDRGLADANPDDDDDDNEVMRPRFHQPRFKESMSLHPRNVFSSSAFVSASAPMPTSASASAGPPITNVDGNDDINNNNNIKINNINNTLSNGHAHADHDHDAILIDNDVDVDVDVDPRKGNNLSIGNVPGPVGNQNNRVGASVNHVEDDDDDDDDDDGIDVNGDEDGEWTLRKCNAAALDVLSCLYKDEVLEIAIPELREKLNNRERWEQRECGVLAVGAVGEGCYDGMARHLRWMLPYLLHCTSDEHAMVRSIGFWTMSRYCKWIISERDDVLFQKVLKAFLDGMVDENKTVQRACCSALATFEEESGSLLTCYLSPILSCLTRAFELYGRGNLYVLYDVVCTLADGVGSQLGESDHVNVLMPLLIKKWNRIGDVDAGMLPLLECLASVFRALGSRCQAFAPNVFSRCCCIIDGIYATEANGDRDNVHVEFITCCLDLLCALAEALGSSLDPFVSKSYLNSSSTSSSPSPSPLSSLATTNPLAATGTAAGTATSNTTTANTSSPPPLPTLVTSTSPTSTSTALTTSSSPSPSPTETTNNIISDTTTTATTQAQTAGKEAESAGSKSILALLFVCLKDSRQEVRQSAFAFLGELARARLPSIIPALPDYFQCTVEALNPQYMSVSNNATWALGELVIMVGFLPPTVPLNRQVIQAAILDRAVDALIHVVNTSQLNKSLLENSALTLGRIGLILPEQLASKLRLFAEPVFCALRNIRDDVEKEQAFYGMNSMIKMNPAAIFDCFAYYVDAVASWFHCKPELEVQFSSILNGYKTALGEQWFSLYNSLPSSSQALLKDRFGL